MAFLKTKTFRILAALALLVALYAVAGFVIAPKLARKAMLENIPKSLGVTPSIGEIHINPFLFKVELKDFALAGAGGEKLVGFQRLSVDFQLSSLWHRAYTFKYIDLTAPFVNAAIAEDGKLNLLQLRPKETTPPPPKSNDPMPSIRFKSFKVTQGLVTYDDRSRPSDFATRLEPINFEVRDFTTGVDGGLFTFTGASKLGEQMEWHGHLSVQPIESDGEFRITGLQAHTLWSYLEDQLNFDVPSGTIDLGATYKFALKDVVGLTVDVSQVALKDLTVRPKGAAPGAAQDWVTVPSLIVSGAKVDLAKRQGHVDSVTLDGVKLRTWLESDGTVNLLTFASTPARAPATAPSAPATTVAPTPVVAPAATPPWAFDVGSLQIKDADISAEDRTVQPAAKVVLAPFSVQVTALSSDLAKPVKVALDTRINEAGSLTIAGDVTPAPLGANLDLKMSGIELQAVQPYIGQHTSMTLLGGKLGGSGKVVYSKPKAVAALRFTGDIAVDDLHTVDNVLRDDFINWGRLDIQGIDFGQGPDHLDIAQIIARKLYTRVIIEPDASLNVTRVLNIKPKTGAADDVDTDAAAPPPPAPVPAPLGATARRGGNAARNAAAAPAGASMPLAIKKISIQGGEANFADLSVAPNFSTGIQKLEGSIVGLSSNPKSRARVDIKGSVDAFSPVSIKGEVNVLSAALYTDMALDFRNMELSTFNPYSGKFAGYNITKGKLTTELHYNVDGRKLDAKHHIVIDQLEFGDKTASKDAVSLPIKLAVALLKDRNGVIELDVPVTGSLDDPKFRLAPIIWKVFVNILEKAVTAPFALLGSLFGGGADLQFIDFQPGVADLDEAANGKAGSVVKALIERPQLKIEVPIAVVPELDRPALVAARYAKQLGDAQAQPEGRKKADASSPAPFDQLDPTAQLDLLTRLYAKDLGGEPKYPESVTGIKTKPEAVAAKIDVLGKAIREHIVVGEAELDALGQQRAVALQKALLADPQIQPERVFLVGNDQAKNQDGVVRLELSLQ